MPWDSRLRVWLLGNAEQAKQTGGMIALYPRADDAMKMAVPGGDMPHELHLTMAYLGEDVTDLDPTPLLNMMPQILEGVTVITARVMGHASFNPDGGEDGTMDPCSVYVISDSEQIPDLHDRVMDSLESLSVDFPLPTQHKPFIPHVTVGYSVPIAELSYTGSVLFDRVGLALGGSTQYYPLLGATQAY